MLRKYFGLTCETWGKDVYGGDYPWVAEERTVIPLYAFLEGDTLGLLMLAQPEETVSVMVSRLMTAARPRVRPLDDFVVVAGDRVLDPGLSVRASGLAALDRVDVRARR